MYICSSKDIPTFCVVKSAAAELPSDWHGFLSIVADISQGTEYIYDYVIGSRKIEHLYTTTEFHFCL